MSEKKHERIDYIVVGQGLAGTLLSYFLLLENKKFRVIDLPQRGTSSSVAAGIINPVTGRRIAKSWRFEELYPFAKKTYRQMEDLLGFRIWFDRNILRALPTVFDENEWLRRSAFPDYAAYFEEPSDLEDYKDKVKPVRAWGELRLAAQVTMPELVSAFRSLLARKNLLIEKKFVYENISHEQGRVEYGDLSADGVIFCEGAGAMHNPYFNWLPFAATKGELLIVKIPGCRFKKLLKHHLFIVPLPYNGSDEVYWVGSTSRFEFEDDLPSEEQRQILEQQLSETLDMPFEVLEHKAGIRPTVFDIRPFLGAHPGFPWLYIFNGMGTKGASLAPFFAKQMVDFLLGKVVLDAEVDIRRFG